MTYLKRVRCIVYSTIFSHSGEKKKENIMSRNAGNAKIAYETATDQGEK